MQKNKLFLILILISAICLRSIHFSKTLNLGTDQAMAYILANHIIKYQHLLLVGPLTSFWEINLLPPTYYYIITILFFILKSEILVSISFMFAGLFSVYFIYLLARVYFTEKTALVSSLLFSFSFPMIEYSRDIWEPFLVPLFVILTFYFLALLEKKEKLIFYYLSLTCFMLSLMYVSSILIIIPYLLLSWNILTKYFKNKPLSFFYVFISFIAFILLTYLPVFVYEATHNFPSYITLTEALSGNTRYLGASTDFPDKVFTNFNIFLSSSLNTPNYIILNLVYIILLILILTELIFKTDKNQNLKKILLILLVPFVLSGFYQQKSEIYRFACLYPFIYLLFGRLISSYKNRRTIFAFTLTCLLLFVYFLPGTLELKKFINIRNGRLAVFAEKTVAEILKHSTYPFIIYVITPNETHNHHGTSYYYALEKNLNKKIVIFNNRGNWIDQNLNPNGKTIFLICKEFVSFSDAESTCLKNFLKEYKLKESARFKANGEYVFKLDK